MPPSRFGPGSVISEKYEVLAVIGHGGMGEVLAVRTTDSGEELALKYSQDTHPLSVRRFAREVRSMEAISHRHVMPVLDAALEHDPPYFVMPKASASLDQEDSHTNEPRALEAFEQILDGIQAIHAAGGTHRDIKPANALRMPDGRVVVSDLGLVKLDPRDTTILTQTVHFIGTRKYCAPEQLLPGGSRGADARTDVYQLGKTLYELLTGRDAALIDVSGMPEGLAHIVRRATRESPDARYRSVGEMRDALAAYRNAQSPDARPLQTLESLALQADELLSRNEYRRETLQSMCAVLATIDEREDDAVIEFVSRRLDERLLSVMGRDLADDFEPALQRYSEAIERGVSSYPYEFAERVASQMKVIFEAATSAEVRVLSLKAVMVAAVELWRFAAMSIFDDLLTSVDRDDHAMAVADMLREESNVFSKLCDRYSPAQLHPIIRAVWDELSPRPDKS